MEIKRGVLWRLCERVEGERRMGMREHKQSYRVASQITIRRISSTSSLNMLRKGRRQVGDAEMNITVVGNQRRQQAISIIFVFLVF